MSFKNTIIVKLNGDTVDIRHNAVMRRGRMLALEKLFNNRVDQNYYPDAGIINYDNTLDFNKRVVCLVAMGSGSAPEGSTNVVTAVNINDDDLAKKVPFRISEHSESNHLFNRYFGKSVDVDKDKFFFKLLNISDQSWDINDNAGIISRLISFKVENGDLEDQYVNEIGFYMGNVVTEGNVVTDVKNIQLFSKIHLSGSRITNISNLTFNYKVHI